MEATEGDDAGDYDKTFLEEPAILDKYKAAADVCESKYPIQYDPIQFLFSCDIKSWEKATKVYRATMTLQTLHNYNYDCSVKSCRFLMDL